MKIKKITIILLSVIVSVFFIKTATIFAFDFSSSSSYEKTSSLIAQNNLDSLNLDSEKTSSGDSIFSKRIGVESLDHLLYKLFDTFLKIAYIFLVLAIIYTGYLFVMARGNADKLKEARSIFLYVIIGGLIILGAEVIRQIICNTVSSFGKGCYVMNYEDVALIKYLM